MLQLRLYYLLKVYDVQDSRVQLFDNPFGRRLHGRKHPLELFVQVHAFSAVNHCLRPLGLPIRIVNAPIGSVETVCGNDIGGQCSVRLERVNRLASFLESLESYTQLFNEFADEWLQLCNGLLREEWVKSTSTESVKVMRYCSEP